MHPRIMILAAFTARTQVYLQAIRNKKIEIGSILTFGEEKGNLPGQGKSASKKISINGLFLPDLNEPFNETLESFECDQIHIDNSDVNSQLLIDRIIESNPDLIVYSGYGGQILSSHFLTSVPTVIHMHSGWLPEYRGSTTMYYSWLKENFVGVSAIIMAPGIDKGDIILRKRYPVAPKEVDPDYLYDPAVRSDTMVDVLEYFISNQELPKPVIQNEDQAEEYYVIHPLLKHLALLEQKKIRENA